MWTFSARGCNKHCREMREDKAIPFRSQAQRKKFYSMASRGEISRDTVTHWESETKGKKLPKRVKPKRPNYKQRKD